MLAILASLALQSAPASRPALFPNVPVTTPERRGREGPPALPSGSTPARLPWDRLSERFDLARRLPRPMPAELTAARATDLEEEIDALARRPEFGKLLRSIRIGGGETIPAEVVRWLPALRAGGVVFGSDWSILPGQGRVDAWNRLEGRPLVLQAVASVLADFDSIQRAQRDYVHLLEERKDDLLDLYPIAGSYVCGEDPKGRPFASLSEQQLHDLPWPYANVPCELHVLERAEEGGRFVTETYSTSRDFYWLAGRDLYLPVDGGFLLVTSFGMDVRGVPDSRGDIADRMKSRLVSIQQDAERRARR